RSRRRTLREDARETEVRTPRNKDCLKFRHSSYKEPYGESICYLEPCRNMCCDYKSTVQLLFNENNFIGPSYFTLRSSRIIFIHNSSHISCAMARNSASALDRATIFSLLLLQVTKFPPRNIQYPEVDLLSTTNLAQSAFVYISMDNIEYILLLGDKHTLFEICNLNPKEFFNLVITYNNHIVYIDYDRNLTDKDKDNLRDDGGPMTRPKTKMIKQSLPDLTLGIKESLEQSESEAPPK
ncbi:hypothetical protein CR513_60059, partial [Mucuna pruriens]